jgi:soluble lytic murein transglycosylase-like protein
MPLDPARPEPAEVRPGIRTRARVIRALALLLALAIAGTAAAGSYKVRRGDTLWELSRRYRTTVSALQELNHMGGSTVIYAGETIRVPGGRAKAAPARRAPARRKATKRPAAAKVRVYYDDVRYSVRPGDNLTRLGRRYSSSVAWLITRNHLRSSVIFPRQVLVVHTTKRIVTPKRKTAARRSATLGLKAVPVATVKALVIREARRAGLDPNLALALATQESGHKQHVVSKVGAIGVMQVMPYTADWAGRYLLHRRVDIRQVEDNVVTGVRFLTFLIRLAGVRDGVAGYYQGLASVRQRGMYNDTKAYVANVLALQRRFAAKRGG